MTTLRNEDASVDKRFGKRQKTLKVSMSDYDMARKGALVDKRFGKRQKPLGSPWKLTVPSIRDILCVVKYRYLRGRVKFPIGGNV